MKLLHVGFEGTPKYGHRYALVLLDPMDIPIPTDGIEDGGEPYTEEEIDTILRREVMKIVPANEFYQGPERAYGHRPSFTTDGLFVLVSQQVGLDV